ncbi:membrane protein [methanotrophic bacterial endosymbiont of Bathymodiolus sp.]|nr:membrane protein [methanotrophic bacterial endosymbiont of Bathymodiolus sp.]
MLKDGSLYYGVLNELQGNQVILQGFKGNRKLPRNKGKAKAQISNLGGLGGLLGGGGLGNMLGLLGGLGKGGAATGTAGGGGFFGNIGSFFKLGMGVISFIMPLMKNFSI